MRGAQYLLSLMRVVSDWNEVVDEGRFMYAQDIPGTTVVASILDQFPSRFTVASGFKELFNASTASPAFKLFK